MSRQLSLFPDLDDGGTSAGKDAGRRSPRPTTTPPGKPPAPTQAASTKEAAPDRLRGLSSLEDLRRKLASRLTEPLDSLVLTDNRRRIISARPTFHGLAVRMHRCFLHADNKALQAVAVFLESSKGELQRTIALQVIRSYFDRHRPETTAPPSRLHLQPVGRHFDLTILRDRLNQRYFDSALQVEITWGRAPRVRRRRRRGFSILLGSYTEADRLVRIHPCLDSPDVPEYVVESVVYHEMLHAALPTERRNGRRRLHTPEFRRRERLYHDFDKADRWLEANLSRLAASR